MLKCVLAFLMMALGSLCGFADRLRTPKNFAVYYGLDAPASKFNNFDLVVLESENSNLAQDLKKSGKTVLAYLSLGEINKEREYFEEAKRAGLLLEENPNWPGAFVVDIRKQKWEKMILDELIPPMLEDGFDGIFSDTFDSPIEQERINPNKFAGMKEAAKRIVEGMRKKFPNMKIMLNRAYPIVPEIASKIDFVLGESILGTYDFKDKKYILTTEAAYHYEVELLKGFKKDCPSLQIMTLDYCGEADSSRRQQIMKRQRENGFIPYVTTIGLDKPPLP